MLCCGLEVNQTNEELTLKRPSFIGTQHDIDHQGELRSALTESLNESEHA